MQIGFNSVEANMSFIIFNFIQSLLGNMVHAIFYPMVIFYITIIDGYNNLVLVHRIVSMT